MPDINLNPYTAESEAIARRLRMAEMLAQQSMQPMALPQQPGVRVSHASGLAKMLDAYTAGKEARAAKEEQKALAERYQGDVSSDFQTMIRALQAPAQVGQPAIEPTLQEGQSTITQGGQAVIPARPAGYLPAEGLSGIKTEPMRQAYMAQLLAQAAPKAPIKASAGDVFLDPVTLKPVTTIPKEEEFNAPVSEFDPNTGKTLKVAYSKAGTRKVIETGGAYTPDQWNSMSVADKARIIFDQYKFGNLSAEQILQAGQKNAQLAQDLQKLIFETGKGGAGPVPIPANAPMPTAVSAPVAAPTQPVAGTIAPPVAPVVQPRAKGKPYTPLNAPTVAPAVAPAAANMQPTVADQPPAGLSPKAQQQWMLDQAKLKTEADKAEQKKSRNLEQLPTLISSAKSILKGEGGLDAKGNPIKTPLPTQSYGGAAMDFLGGIIGQSPQGAGPADRLKVIGGAMTMAMPRMEGPQSDADTRLYREMAGRVGDETLSIQRRLDALDEVEKIYSKYGKSSGWKVVK